MAAVDYAADYPDQMGPDGSGGVAGFPAGGAGPIAPASGGAGSFDAAAEVNKIFAGSGMAAGETDVANLAGKNAEDRNKFLADLTAQRDLRAAPTSGRTEDSQSVAGNTLYGSGTGNKTNALGGAMAGYPQGTKGLMPMPTAAPAATRPFNGGGSTVGAQFTDPISSFLEQFAQTRAQQLENPAPDSGQALLEQALKSIAAQFSSGGYTPAQQEILNTQAMEPIEQLRQQRKQQVLVQLSQRQIDPQSGVGRQMLADVDRQFDQLKIQQSRTLGNQAVNEQQQRLMQSIQLLQTLAGGENARLDQGYQYRTVPYNLQQQAFQNASGLYNSAGNPLSLINPLLQASQQQQSQQDAQGAALADLIWALTNAAH